MAKLYVMFRLGNVDEYDGNEAELKATAVELADADSAAFDDDDRIYESFVIQCDDGREESLVEDYVPFWETTNRRP